MASSLLLSRAVTRRVLLKCACSMKNLLIEYLSLYYFVAFRRNCVIFLCAIMASSYFVCDVGLLTFQRSILVGTSV